MLDNNDLLSSETVVNAAMNRGRGLSGVNSYERELRMSILPMLEERVRRTGQAVWYDACCGEGRALREASEQLAATASRRNIRLVGADLWDAFPPAAGENLRFVAADVVNFDPGVPVDLITCVHGLHYLGDKLGFLETAYARLAPGGIFVGHLDTTNLRAKDDASIWPALMRRIRVQGILVRYSSHLLRLERNDAVLDFGVAYQGATVSAQANYSGMIGVDSWYALTR